MHSTQTNSNVKFKYHLALDALFLLMQQFRSYILLEILADYSFSFWLCSCVICMMILSATALKQNFHSHFHQISADVTVVLIIFLFSRITLIDAVPYRAA